MFCSVPSFVVPEVYSHLFSFLLLLRYWQIGEEWIGYSRLGFSFCRVCLPTGGLFVLRERVFSLGGGVVSAFSFGRKTERGRRLTFFAFS